MPLPHLVLGGLVLVVAASVTVELSRRARAGSRSERATHVGRLLVGCALALLCAAIWSLSYVSLSYLSRDLPALQVNMLLLGGGAVALFAGSGMRLPSVGATGRQAEVLRAMGAARLAAMLLANLGNFVLSIYALYFISASQAITLNNLSPLFLAGVLIVRRKLRFDVTIAAAIILVSAGTWVITAQQGFSVSSERSAIGSGLAILAGVSFAVWGDLAEDVEQRIGGVAPRLRLLGLVFLGSFLVVLPFALQQGFRQLRTLDVLIIGANGVRVAIVYVLLQAAIRNAGPLLTFTLLAAQVPLTFIWDSLFLGTQTASALVLGAAAIVTGGVALVVRESAPGSTL